MSPARRAALDALPRSRRSKRLNERLGFLSRLLTLKPLEGVR